MGAELRFVDTNVLVYLFDTDAPAKQALRAGRLDLGKSRRVARDPGRDGAFSRPP
jgi:predicted nucleic acid-binding protein